MSLKIRCLSPKEEERLLVTLRKRKDAERAYMLYDLMLITGLRLTEALSLNVEAAGRAKIEVKVKGWTQDGKKKERFKTVYLPKALREHLQNYLRFKRRRGESLAPDAPLIVSRHGRRLSGRQVQRDLKRWLKEAGVEGNFTPHALRHTAGTRLLKKTRNHKLVQKYLGHSDVATTLRFYVDVFPEDLENAAELLADREQVPA